MAPASGRPGPSSPPAGSNQWVSTLTLPREVGGKFSNFALRWVGYRGWVESFTPAVASRLLRASAAAIAAEVRALPPELARQRPKADEWCALEVVGHVIEAERRGFAGRIRLLVSEDEPVLQTWDQPAVAAARRDCEREPEALVRELVELREGGARMLEQLEPQDLERAGQHPTVGRLTVGEVMHEWVHHDRAHLKQVVELSQAFAWPQMGNAQLFSR
jgi:DinB superfamily